ncbi:MAG: hypothetical protein R3A48_27990 [Polyangiales bacterium]
MKRALLLALFALGCSASETTETIDVPAVFDVPIAPADAPREDVVAPRDAVAPDAPRDAVAPDAPRDAVALDAPGDAGCASSSECAGATPVCDRGTGRCVACSASEDRCGAGSYCNANRCETGCRDDSACGRGDGGAALRCDLNRRVCVACRGDDDCALGSLCMNGNACVPGCSMTHGCPEGESCCAGLCQRTRVDPAHCGACGAACSLPNATPRCEAGACAVASCAAGFASCDGVAGNGCEVDTRVAVAHCGACDNACPARPNSTPTCAAGRCGIACAAGFADCNADPSDGCEARLDSSAAHCGRCGNACSGAANATGACVSGACRRSCAPGFADCDGNEANGCEASLLSPSSCGACGVVCGPSTPLCAGSGATPRCSSGCGSTELRCGSACVDPMTSASNCGACGNACAPRAGATVSCSGGACRFACAAGRADCDANAANGCEVDATSSLAHCGACGRACGPFANASAACRAGACGIGACNAGFADCDGDPANGCEVNLNTDVAHCGRCGGACSRTNIPTPTCVAGVCGGTCAAGFNDCNRDRADGCEADLSNDPANCGACGSRCSTGVCGTSLALPMGGSAPSRWSLNGAATWDPATGGVALVPAERGQAGTAWYANPLTGDEMTVDFEFRVGGGTRADGLAFALQRTGNNVVGRGGSGFGVVGLDGWAVELDVYNNGTCMDANGNHVGVDTLSVCEPAVGTPTSLQVSGDLPFDVVDNAWHPMRVRLVRGAAEVTVQGQTHLTGVALPGLGTTTSYWLGFGAATGDFAARHDVRNVRVVYPTPRCL